MIARNTALNHPDVCPLVSGISSIPTTSKRHFARVFGDWNWTGEPKAVECNVDIERHANRTGRMEAIRSFGVFTMIAECTRSGVMTYPSQTTSRDGGGIRLRREKERKTCWYKQDRPVWIGWINKVGQTVGIVWSGRVAERGRLEGTRNGWGPYRTSVSSRPGVCPTARVLER